MPASRAFAPLVSVLAAACATPTAITVSVDSEVGCDGGAQVVVVGGVSLGALSTAAVSSTASACTAGPTEANVGGVVLVPAGPKNEGIAFAVMTRDDGEPPDDCLSPTADTTHCIVAKRQLLFIPRTELSMRVDLRLACKGILCSAEQTCVEGTCVSAVVDGEKCKAGCNEGLLLGDGGAPDAGPGTSGDAGPDPSAACGDTSGLQAGAPWPLAYGCPTNTSRTLVVGPKTGATKLGPVATMESDTSLVVGADSQVIVSNYDTNDLLSFNGTTGAPSWPSPPSAGNTFAGAIDNQGTIYVPTDAGALVAVDAMSGAILWTYHTSGVLSSVVIGQPGTLYFGSQGFGVTALSTTTQSQIWHFPLSGNVNEPPALGNGVLYFIDAKANQLYALTASTGAMVFQVPLAGPPVGAAVLGQGAVYVTTSISGGGDTISAFDAQSGQTKWAAMLTTTIAQPAMLSNGDLVASGADSTARVIDPTSGSVLRSLALGSAGGKVHGLVVDADDDIYVETSAGVVALTPAGTVLWASMLRGELAMANSGLVVLSNSTASFSIIGP